MKVLTVIAHYWPVVGGAENQARRLAGELRRQDVEVEVFTGRWSRESAAFEEIDGIPVHRLGPGLELQPVRLRRWLFLLALLRRLASESARFDVIHAHQLLYPAFAVAVAGRLCGRPTLARVSSTGSTSDLVIAARGGLGLQGALTRRLLSRVVAVSGASEAECLAHGYPAERIVRIPNGVPVPDAPRERPRRDRVTALYLGGLRTEKRLPVLLEAWECAGRPGRLLLAGEGPERGRLQAIADTQRGTVQLLGHVSDACRLLADADVFVLASDAEGMSNALLEAMAAGCACLATHVGGNVDMLAPGAEVPRAGSFHVGSAGLLAAVGDVAGLAGGLRALAEDAALRQQLSVAAWQKARDEYALPAVASRYRALYQELMRSNPVQR